MKKHKHKLEKTVQREIAKSQGYFDGRFRPRVVEDKKKVKNKTMCRRKSWKKHLEL